MFKYISLLTIFSLFTSSYSFNNNNPFYSYNEPENTTTNDTLIQALLDTVFLLGEQLNLTSLILNSDFDKCFASLVNSTTSELHSWVKSETLTAFDACGKYLADYGFPDDCLTNPNQRFKFFLLNYTLNISEFQTTSQYPEMKFMNQQHFYTGFCMFTECMDILEYIFNSNLNPTFANYLHKEAGITEYNIITNETKFPINTETIEFKLREISCIFLTVIIYIIFFGSIIICIIRLSCFFSFRWRYLQYLKQNELDDDQSQTNSSISDDIPNEVHIKHQHMKENDIISRSKKIFEDELIRRNSFSNNIKQRFTNIFVKYATSIDPFLNFYNLITKKNYWYNDTGLELITFLRACINLGLSLFYNFLIIRDLPPKNLFNKEFFTLIHLLIIKIASYSHICWVILDGLVMSFKLFNMIKDYFKINCEKQITYKIMLKYFSLVIPKIIMFVFIYFYFYICGTDFNTYSSSLLHPLKNKQGHNLLHYYWHSIVKPGPLYYSANVPIYKILFPYVSMNAFHLCPLQNGEDSHWPISILFVAQIMINEFYCFVFYLIVIYFAFKLKNNVYDIIIQVFIIILSIVITICIGRDDISNEIGCYLNFLGNMKHEFHLLFTLYYYGLGVLLGICYFYYHDIRNNYSSIQSGKYVPFELCKIIVKKIFPGSRKQLIINVVTLILSVLIMFVGITIFAFEYIKESINETPLNQNTISMKMRNMYVNWIYHWEKVFISYLFMIVFLVLTSFIKGTSLEYFLQSSLSIFVERISSIFFIFLPWFIVFAYSRFMFQYSLGFQNLSFFAIGLNMSTVVICVLFHLFLETFFRKILKFNYIRPNDWERFHKDRDVIEDDLSISETNSLHDE